MIECTVLGRSGYIQTVGVGFADALPDAGWSGEMSQWVGDGVASAWLTALM